MSARPKASISKKTPAPLVEQAALAMVRQLVEQGRANEVYRELYAHPAGRAVIKEKHPGPKNVIAVLSGFTDAPIDNTYGYIVDDAESHWLFTLFSEMYAFQAGGGGLGGARCRLGGVVLHCEDEESAIESLTGAIQNLDLDEFYDVVRDGLGIQIDEEEEDEDEDEDEDEEDGDTERVFDHGDWIKNHGEELGNALKEKLDDLVDDAKLLSQEDVDEVMGPRKVGGRVRGTIIIDANSWE